MNEMEIDNVCSLEIFLEWERPSPKAGKSFQTQPIIHSSCKSYRITEK